MMMDRREHIPPLPSPSADKMESFTCSEPVQTSRKTKNRNKNKRRFSDEQVKSLESMFETETKLEARKKVQLARELGLQPRQVAIWFQNKRARWRSKHMEKEYSLLKSDYDNLSSRYESLKIENQSLLIQKLRNPLEQPRDRNKDGEERSNDKIVTDLDEDKSRNVGNLASEEWHEEIMNKVDNSPASLEKWRRVDACGLFDQPCSDSHWWEFWTLNGD